MMTTKRQYGKTDGIVAFHSYQSFKEGEVTPNIAHEIGVKLAEEMWDDYEVIVATHQNTNYIHNHFIINSVSYKTGKKYNNNKATYARLRHISDALCREYGLSTLEEDTRYKNSYKNNWQDNDYYRITKEDIDTVINESMYKYYKPISQRTIYQQYLSKTKNNHKGIYGLYLYYCYLLKAFPQEHPKQNLPASIRKDIKKLDQITEETRFMVNNKIETLEDLLFFKEQNSIKLAELVSKRANLWRKYKRAKTEDDKFKIYNEIEGLQPRIKELYNNRRYYDGIEKRSINIQNNIDNFDRDINLLSDREMIKINAKF